MDQVYDLIDEELHHSSSSPSSSTSLFVEILLLSQHCFFCVQAQSYYLLRASVDRSFTHCLR